MQAWTEMRLGAVSQSSCAIFGSILTGYSQPFLIIDDWETPTTRGKTTGALMYIECPYKHSEDLMNPLASPS